MVYIAIYSYIADTVSPENKAVRMIIIDVIGRGLGGFAHLGIGDWIKESYFWPYAFVFGCNFLAALYAFFLIPESLHTVQQSNFKLRDILASI